MFELLTSDLLFAAEEKVGHYTRDDDQLAQMIELLGDFPYSRKLGGERGRQFFTSQGQLPLSFRRTLSGSNMDLRVY